MSESDVRNWCIIFSEEGTKFTMREILEKVQRIFIGLLHLASVMDYSIGTNILNSTFNFS